MKQIISLIILLTFLLTSTAAYPLAKPLVSQDRVYGLNIRRVSDYEWRNDYFLRKKIWVISNNIFEEIGLKDYDRNAFKESFTRKDSIALIAEMNGEIIGFINGFRNSDDEFYIAFIGVDKNYRKKKVGDRLALALVNKLRRQGYKYIAADTIKESIPSGATDVKCSFVDSYKRQHYSWRLALQKPAEIMPVDTQSCI